MLKQLRENKAAEGVSPSKSEAPVQKKNPFGQAGKVQERAEDDIDEQIDEMEEPQNEIENVLGASGGANSISASAQGVD
tara:strand:+ start:332 stop:568 length:237 start_codon:yes stop_codon:yes gene_type:complete